MKKLENVKETIKQNVKTYVMDLIVILTSLAYVFYQMVDLKPADVVPVVLTIKTVVGIIAGCLIKYGLGEIGFIKGYQSKEYTEQEERYNIKAEKALPYIDSVEDFYAKERVEKIWKTRKIKLAGCRMKYETFFDENGDYIEHIIWSPKQRDEYLQNNKELPPNVVVLDKKQVKVLYKCIELKVYVRDMFSSYEQSIDDEETDPTEQKQRAKLLKRNIVIATGLSLMGVYFLPTFKFDWGHVIIASFQVALWISLGVVQEFTNINFVRTKLVNVLKKKEQDLSKFLIACEGREKFKADNEKVIEQRLKMANKANANSENKDNEKTESPKYIEVEMTEEELKAKGLIK